MNSSRSLDAGCNDNECQSLKTNNILSENQTMYQLRRIFTFKNSSVMIMVHYVSKPCAKFSVMQRNFMQSCAIKTKWTKFTNGKINAADYWCQNKENFRTNDYVKVNIKR